MPPKASGRIDRGTFLPAKVMNVVVRGKGKHEIRRPRRTNEAIMRQAHLSVAEFMKVQFISNAVVSDFWVPIGQILFALLSLRHVEIGP